MFPTQQNLNSNAGIGDLSPLSSATGMIDFRVGARSEIIRTGSHS
jgi:hypothetical protein